MSAATLARTPILESPICPRSKRAPSKDAGVGAIGVASAVLARGERTGDHRTPAASRPTPVNERQKIEFRQGDHAGFDRTVKERVSRHFEVAGRSKHGDRRAAGKATLYAAGVVASYALIRFLKGMGAVVPAARPAGAPAVAGASARAGRATAEAHA